MSDLWSFNTIECTWTEVKTAGEPPEPRSFHKALSIGTKMFVFGGCGKEGRLSDIHSIDLDLSAETEPEWKALSVAPPEGLPGRGGASFLASSDGSSLFVVGGFIGSESNAVFRFDLANGVWHEVHPEGNQDIKPFSVSSGATLGDTIALFGGEVEESSKGHEGAGGFCDTLLLLDGISGEVLSRDACNEERPRARGWGSASAWGDDKLVLFGGLSGSDDEPTRLDDTWILRRKTS